MASLKKLPANKLVVNQAIVNKTIVNKKASLLQQLQSFLTHVFSNQQLVNPKLVLAFSGGLDSCVLLHLLTQAKKTLPFQLTAHHVHHGLSPNADAWLVFCKHVCSNLNIPLTITKVQVENNGLGLEATARLARYKVLLDADADFICLAQHQDDQAETFLLQLARGAGVKGLAAMATENGKLLRPLLDAPRKALESYAKQHRLVWVEDESNIDTQFDRNFIRHEVLPILKKQYPSIQQTISRSAKHMAEANELLHEIALQDIQTCTDGKKLNSPLNLHALQLLSPARISNVLRWWLVQNACSLPSTAQLQQITQQLFTAKTDAMVKIKVSDMHSLQRYRDYAFLLAETEVVPAINVLWQGEDVVTLPDGTSLKFSQQLGLGFAINRVPNIKLRIKNREGGERFRPDLGRPSRSLKTVLQTAEIPPWQRAQLPLIFMDETLVIIPNVGVDASFQAEPNELGLSVYWKQHE